MFTSSKGQASIGRLSTKDTGGGTSSHRADAVRRTVARRTRPDRHFAGAAAGAAGADVPGAAGVPGIDGAFGAAFVSEALLGTLGALGSDPQFTMATAKSGARARNGRRLMIG